MLIQLTKSENDQAANSIEPSLDFMGDKWMQEDCSGGIFYVFKGSLSQSCTMAQTLIIIA